MTSNVGYRKVTWKKLVTDLFITLRLLSAEGESWVCHHFASFALQKCPQHTGRLATSPQNVAEERKFPKILGKSRLVKYYNLARFLYGWWIKILHELRSWYAKHVHEGLRVIELPQLVSRMLTSHTGKSVQKSWCFQGGSVVGSSYLPGLFNAWNLYLLVPAAWFSAPLIDQCPQTSIHSALCLLPMSFDWRDGFSGKFFAQGNTPKKFWGFKTKIFSGFFGVLKFCHSRCL